MERICPATKNTVDVEYCDGDCINCPWITLEVEPLIGIKEG